MRILKFLLYSRQYRGCLGLLWIFIVHTCLAQNCALDDLYDEPIIIRDESTVSLRIKIENARFNDMAEGFQGLCGVRLSFNHGNLSDLMMTVTTPGGNSVTLIGPADKNGTNPVVLLDVEHDILFIPTNEIADPHPDLPAQWTNNNINWGQNPPYTGRYFPFNGDFSQDLKVGSVNGIWELTISDAFINDQGLLRAFELVICDDTGIVCSPCESRAGVFLEERLTLCKGESLDYLSLYESNNFDTMRYTDQLLIYRDGNLISYDSLVDFSLLPTGDFEIFGLNIETEVLDSVRADLQSLTQAAMMDYIDQAGGLYCVSRSESIGVHIKEPLSSVTLDTIVLCNGQFKVFGGDTLRTTGLYDFRSDDCDSILVLPVVGSTLQITDAPPELLYLDCSLQGTLISVGVSSDREVDYTWFNVSGQELSTDSLYVATESGLLQLVISDGYCTVERDITILDPRDTLTVSLITSASELNCRDEEITARFEANFLIESFEWYQDNTNLGVRPSITITEEGLYGVEAFDINGCGLSDSIRIIRNTNVPNAALVLDTITCVQSIASIRALGDSISSYEWYDSDNTLIGTDTTIDIMRGGQYTLRVESNNFCDSLIAFEVMEDTSDISIGNIPSEFVLNCVHTDLELIPTIAGGVATSFNWSSDFEPNLSRDQDFTVIRPGIYQLIASARNGCTDTAEINIALDTVAPIVTLTGGLLTCANPEVLVMAQAIGDDLIYAWSGSYDRANNDTSVWVTAPGMYTVGVLDTVSECLTISSIDISDDGALPMIRLEGDSILDCDHTQPIVRNVTPGLFNPTWTTPKGEVVEGDSILLDQGGQYIFEALGANGCSATRTWQVVDNLAFESLELQDTIILNCSTPQVLLAPTISAEIESITWIDDGDTIIASTFNLSQRAEISVIVRYTNGCEEEQQISVLEDMTMPDINIISDTIDCAHPEVIISTSVFSDRYAYQWMGAFDGRGDTSFVSVSSPEIITLRVTDVVNGCTNSERVTVIEDKIPITADSIIITRFLDCRITEGRIAVITDEPVSVVWTDPDSNIFMSPTGIVDRIGHYSLTVTGTNGCEFSREWVVEDLSEPVNVDFDSLYLLSCTMPTLTVAPNTIDAGSRLSWFYADGDTIVAPQQTISHQDGLLGVYVEDAQSCDTTIMLTIQSDTTPPLVDVLTADTLDCSGGPLQLTGTVASEQDILIEWLRWGEVIFSGGMALDATQSGTYILQAVSQGNGCIGSDSVRVQLSESPLAAPDISTTDEVCLGDQGGTFELRQINGGQGSVVSTFNNQNIQVDQLVPDLSPGVYNLVIQDELGCQWDSEITIQEGKAYSVSLGTDRVIDRGESVLILPTYSQGEPILNEYEPIIDVPNGGIDSVLYSPDNSGFLSVTSTSIEGCMATDSVFIAVNSNLNSFALYIPNVITPELSGDNSRIDLHLIPEIASVDFFRIFDRWGQALVALTGSDLQESTQLWDARFRGQLVAAGVYTYVYQVTSSLDGTRRIISGDITVIR